MQFMLVTKYISNIVPIFFLHSKVIFTSTLIVFLPSFFIAYYVYFLKYSFFFKSFFLLDTGVYEIPVFFKNNLLSFKNVVYYIFKNIKNYFLFLFSILENNVCNSIEQLFRNAKWLERENSEFFDIFYENKVDRRSLFTIPIFYESPLKKKFPVTGFYELFSCFLTKKVKFKHVSFKN